MTEIYKPAIRAFVVASLLLATAMLMFVAVNTARAAGALAVGACGAFGEAYDFATVAEARQTALSKCQGPTCRIVTVARRGCAAFAIDFKDPCAASGWGEGPRLGGTQNAALEACYQHGGKDCVIRTFFCDARG
ncbi:MAG: DUF4189 domain-containing protein [Rhodopseudomonas sp.]|nr:DUF4189 domain-containing protein [Rhodopseudomonas sp.]